MRDDIGETENIFRVKAKESTDKLLALIMQHHGEEEIEKAVKSLRNLFIPVDTDDEEGDLIVVLPPVRGILIEEIQAAVAVSFGVSRAEMISERRKHNVILPRHIAMFLCRELTPRSMPAIGRKFGDRDHTTVHYAIGKIEGLIAADPILAAKVDQIRLALAA